MMLGLAAAATFNLVCSGTATTTGSLSSPSSKPWSQTFRIDLDQKRWCDGDCRDTGPIADVSATKLILENKDTNSPGGRITSFTAIDRETGAYQSSLIIKLIHSRPSVDEWKGACTLAPFTGFPKVETKF